MWWCPSIDDKQSTRQAFEKLSAKRTVYFFVVLAIMSGVLALVGIIQLAANPMIVNRIPEPVVLTVVGISGFAFFWPSFAASYFSRHFLMTVKQLELQIERLRHVVEDGDDDIG